MSASIPVSVPVFTTLQDDVDYVLAADQNTPNDEITALATLVGMLGKSQSWGVDYVSAMKNAKSPICTKKDADEIYVSAGVVWIANTGQTFRMPRRNTAVLTLSAADLDAGSFADDTLYYIHAVADSAANTFTCKISLSATAPTGLTNFEVIGWFWNQSAGALDITIDYVGNVKANNRDVPNVVTKKSAVQTSTASTSFVDDTEALLKFYSSGRPLLIIYDIQSGQSASATGDVGLSVDGADVSDTERWVASGNTSTNKYGNSIFSVQKLAAGIHTIQGRMKASGGTAYVNAREITVIEL